MKSKNILEFFPVHLKICNSSVSITVITGHVLITFRVQLLEIWSFLCKLENNAPG